MDILKHQLNNQLLTNNIPIGSLLLNTKTYEYITQWNQSGLIDHSEILIIQKGQHLNWDFTNCIIFITCEPCSMCLGALCLIKIPIIIFGCYNDKFGSYNQNINLLNNNNLYKPMIIGGIMEDYWIHQLKLFFKNLRNK
jgi:tRNA(adenine34) deaminase